MPVKKAKSWTDHINFNSLLMVVLTTGLGWITTNSLESVKKTQQAVTETKQSVAQIQTAIPYINQNVMSLQTDLNQKHVDLRQQIGDLKDGQKQAWGAIKEVREKQERLKDQLSPTGH